MSFVDHLQAVASGLKLNLAHRVLAHRLLASHPSLICDPSVVWDYGLDDLDAIELGKKVSIHPFARIVVRKHSPLSKVRGRLILEDQAYVGSGAKLVAAGGTIRFGIRSGVAQNSIVVCTIPPLDEPPTRPLDRVEDEPTDIVLEDNVWVGAGCVLLPGTHIGEGAVIAAGSVVSGRVPPAELWAGNPARKLRSLS